MIKAPNTRTLACDNIKGNTRANVDNLTQAFMGLGEKLQAVVKNTWFSDALALWGCSPQYGTVISCVDQQNYKLPKIITSVVP